MVSPLLRWRRSARRRLRCRDWSRFEKSSRRKRKVYCSSGVSVGVCCCHSTSRSVYVVAMVFSHFVGCCVQWQRRSREVVVQRQRLPVVTSTVRVRVRVRVWAPGTVSRPRRKGGEQGVGGWWVCLCVQCCCCCQLSYCHCVMLFAVM